jgi:hypothetical protein
MYIPEPMSGCWLWLGCVNKDGGYGLLTHHRRQYSAHRFSWLIHRGEIPPEICVLHKCDTPSCINPDHLFLGTTGDNSRDRERKKRGRTSRQFGEDNLQTKLTTDDIQAIRADTRLQREIAKDYGIRQTQVSRIKTRQRWAHLP